MKLSQKTIAILKNLALNNQNIVFLPGNKLSTISTEGNLVAYVEIEEEFPTKFGIYDLPEFISLISLFDDTELEFHDKYVNIKSGKNNIKYYSSNVDVLKLPVFNEEEVNIPGIVYKFPETTVKLELSVETLNMVKSTTSILKTQDFSLIGDGTNIRLVVGDRKNATSHKYDIIIEKSKEEFSANFKINNLKILPLAYEINISPKKMCKFTNDEFKVTYFIGLEVDSSFN